MAATSACKTRRVATHLVTGVAGFIGSQIAEALVAGGESVVGVDCFTPYYPRTAKEENLAQLRDHDRFSFHDVDLRTDQIEPLLDQVSVVYHQAAQPGVRLSWSDGFETYERCNVLGTQRLLEAARGQQVSVAHAGQPKRSSRKRHAVGLPCVRARLVIQGQPSLLF